MDGRCPKCSQDLVKSADGRIGRCKVHGWFPVVEGAEAEAARQNDEEKKEKDRTREQELFEAEQKREKRIREYRQKIIIAISAIAAVFIILGCVFFAFVIRPGTNYSKAEKLFEAGQYEAAREAFTNLGDYKEASVFESLCSIMIKIQSDSLEDAVTAVNELNIDNSKSALSASVEMVSTLLTDWKEKDIPPELVLALLEKIGNTPLRDSLDKSAIWADAHVAMLSDDVFYYWQKDINEDDQPDLIVIHKDGMVSTYNMNASGNRSITVSDSVISTAAMEEAQAVHQKDYVAGVCCMAVSCRIHSDNNNYDSLEEYTSELIEHWKATGIDPERVLDALGMAVCLGGMDVNDAFRTTWQETALAVSAESRQYTFVDWNYDGLDELLMLNHDNQLLLYGYKTSWKLLSDVRDLPVNASYNIASDVPIIIVIGDAKDSLMSLTSNGNELHVLFTREGISNYKEQDSMITYSTVLPGSIDRTGEWKYEPVSSDSRPVRTGIEWNKTNYPMPATADEALQRYIEASVYNIAEEKELLIADKEAEAFSIKNLEKSSFPDSIDKVEFASYSSSEDEVLYEVSADVEGRTKTQWYAVRYDGQWKIAGISDTFSKTVELDSGDTSVELISTNKETTDAVAEKGSRKTYRMLLPEAGRVSMQWQAGTANENSPAFSVGLYQNSVVSEPLITWQLKPQVSKQQTRQMFLAPGVYYITVEAKTNARLEYHLTLFADSDPDIELEGNNDSESATPVTPGQTISGNLLTSNDTDCYSFKVSQNEAVNVMLRYSGSNDKKTVFSGGVYNKLSGEKITEFDLAGNMVAAETGNMYLSSGEYIIMIKKGASWTDEEYDLSITTQSEGVIEAEMNNTPETSNMVPVNEDIHASIGTDGDVDYFRFSLDSDAAIQLKFTFPSTGYSSKTYILTVMDSTQNVLQIVNIGGEETSKVIAPLALKAGTYTVKVENPKFTKQEYTLRIICEDIELSETEPNNAASAATVLEPGKTVTGVLTSEKDEDYYKITFDSPTTITVSFHFTQGTGNNTAFILALELNGKTEWKQNIKGTSGGVDQAMNVPPGEYYIRIKPGSSWNGNLYTILIN